MSSPKISICLDNPTLSYFPGQLVSGRILIKTKYDKNVQGLLLKLRGAATTHWTQEKTETSGFKKCKLVREISKCYDDSDIFFEFKNYILGNGQNDVTIPVGESSFPFYIQLPTKNMPSSYLGPFGKVEYVMEANLKRPKWKSVLTAKMHITVNAAVDLNNIWQANEPGQWKATRRFGLVLLSSGKVKMDVNLKGRAYCPGEFIPVDVDVKNKSDRKVTELSAEIIQETIFHARNKIADTNKRKTIFTINMAKKDGGVNTGDCAFWRTELQVPPVPPTQLGGGCKLIEVQYFLLVTAHFTDPLLNMKQKCPLIIGTIPLRSKFAELSAPTTPNVVAPSIHSMPNGYCSMPPILFRHSFNFIQDQEADSKSETSKTPSNPDANKTLPQESPFVPTYVTYHGLPNYGPRRPSRVKKELECIKGQCSSGK